MALGGVGWVKNFSVGIRDGAPSTAHSSFICIFEKSTATRVGCSMNHLLTWPYAFVIT